MERNSTKNLVVVILIALGIIGAGIFAARDPGKTAEKQGGGPLTTENRSLYQDPDNDGLFDWQEALWKTNPKNPDTDGDGTPDGEEVKLNRDPLTKGPDDGLFKIKETAGDQQTNISEGVAKKIVSDYFSESSRDPNIQLENIVESLPQSLAADLQSSLIEDRLTRKDIYVLETDSEQTKRDYLNTVATILKSHAEFHTDTLNEILLINVLIEESRLGDASREFAPYIKNYTAALDKLRAAGAPTSFADNHLELLNILNNVMRADMAMSRAGLDPTQALIGMISYINLLERMGVFLEEFQNKIGQYNIALAPHEPAIIFISQ